MSRKHLEPWPVNTPIPASCSVETIARVLNVSVDTVTRAIANGTLPVVELRRFGRSRRFTGVSVAALLKGQFDTTGRSVRRAS
jgi:excisionase family DNA binding protein